MLGMNLCSNFTVTVQVHAVFLRETGLFFELSIAHSRWKSAYPTLHWSMFFSVICSLGKLYLSWSFEFHCADSFSERAILVLYMEVVEEIFKTWRDYDRWSENGENLLKRK